ncbi:hypothetical protein M0R45_034669 [Rubus argutus]|uniref:Uncharacterized protein n=1 Tax=Rubus argutus TaxID=59490 RepID=A0AAW1VQU7_RUBAR
MCMNFSEMIPFSPVYSAFRLRRPSKHHNVRVRPPNQQEESNNKRSKEKEMEIKNLKLYMENKSIIEENNELRRKALLLVQENQALLSQLQQKFSRPNSMHAGATMKHDNY